MRISHCESHCAHPLCYLPCLPKSKDARTDAVSAAPSAVGVAAVTEDKPPPVQKIEVEVEDNGGAAADDDNKEEEKEKKAAAVAPKSSLKKANCADSKDAARGNVKWMDLLGKDLAEVREFEPSESGDSQDDGDGDPACICVIQ